MTITVPQGTPKTHDTVLSKTDFKGLFTPEEYRAISNASTTDDIVFQFWDMAQTADNIDVNDSRTQGGLSYIQAIGVLTPERHAEILQGKPL